MDQISEGGRNIHEIDKIRKRLEAEKVELTAALEEAESILEQEENKVLRCQLELNQVKQDIERRLKEKDEEFEMIRKTHAKAVESMQMALEVEAKSKAEALRMKKKLEADICELDIALESANATGIENQRTIKKYQNMIKEVQETLDIEMQARDSTRDAQATADRKVHALQTELEEIRTHLETSDRARRVAEQDLVDAHDHLSELMLQNNSIVAAKRKLESEMQALHTELDETLGETRLTEDKAHNAMIDAARLAEELRAEQEAAQAAQRQRHQMELQVKDTQTRLDEMEQAALKGGKKALARAEHRMRELESQLDEEQRRYGDNNKNLRKAERKMKELQFVQDEDRKNQERMQALVDQLQGKVKTYKKQIEEAEEIAALNLAKFKKVQGHLEEAGERADLNEQAFAKYKAKGRAGSVGPI
jgi:myosin heavy chain 6/7